MSDETQAAKKVPVSATPVEMAFWDSVRDSQDTAQIDLYMEKFPDGFFTELAALRRGQIERLAAAAEGKAAPEEIYVQPQIKHQKIVAIPRRPIPLRDDTRDLPRYLLLAKFFADNDTLYHEDMELVYIGPPNAHMLPINEAAKKNKAEQDLYLDKCWETRCMAEGRAYTPRPREVAEQIQNDQMVARDRGGVVETPGAAPSRPDLATKRSLNPNADRVGQAKPQDTRYENRGSVVPAPVLGREGHRYQQPTKQGFGT